MKPKVGFQVDTKFEKTLLDDLLRIEIIPGLLGDCWYVDGVWAVRDPAPQ